MGPTGALRVYLGAAPGVGKTFRMLEEGHRRRDRGTDVVIAFVECHDRPKTEALLGDLEVVPRVRRTYRDAEFTEMDLEAVLARRPTVALVDELAHTNVPGGRQAKRWQDIQQLLAAGTDVITTVNIQHLESLKDVVAKITGIVQRENVPDEVVRRADQIELVDMTAEALRRRMAHGNIYAPEKIDAALANYFRPGNLTALRELALLWLADRVEEGLKRYRAEHGIAGVWETRERVVVALTGGPEGDTLIRRAARIAAHAGGGCGDLLAVHATRSDGLTGADPAEMAAQRRLVESLGGSYHLVVGDDIPAALLDFAKAQNATQLVLGTSRRGWIARLLGGRGVGKMVTAASGDIDVHLVTHPYANQGQRLPSTRSYLSPRRQLAALAAACTAPPAITAILTRCVASPVPGDLAMISATLLGRIDADIHPDGMPSDNPQQWMILGTAGAPAARCPSEADVTVPVGPDAVLALRGRVLPAADQRVLTAFGAQVAVALDRDRLTRQAAQAKPAIEADRMRTALLAAVSHDLRTPLAAANAAVTSLRSPEVSWSAEDSTELLATAEESLERLTRLVDNLLDMSRLQAGTLAVHPQPVALGELVSIVLDGVGSEAAAVRWRPAPALPPVWADPVLLERVIANLITNALRYSPASDPPVLTASALGDYAELRVIDRGPGIPEADREHIFVPFQRLDDRDNTTGLGLGLALSRGLIEAMDGSLTPEDTPGGGLTMVVTLQLSAPDHGPLEVASAESSTLTRPRGAPNRVSRGHHLSW